jgi:hypothetical protein
VSPEKSSLRDECPDTPEELEKQFPPAGNDKKNKGVG